MNIRDSKSFKSLGLPRLRQLGIVIKDIEKAMEFYSNFLNIKPWYRAKFAEQEILYDGKETEIELDIVLSYSRGLQVELIQIKGGDENIYVKHLEEHGEGLHHLGFYVSNIEKKVKQVEEMEIEVIQSGSLKTQGGALTRFVYFDTSHICGYITEFIETRLFGFKVPQSKIMLSLGSLTGDVSKV